jgi:prepilin-type N-terminal cleavage/methylation domain-containing protein
MGKTLIKSGFTIVELLIVIVVIAVLATIVTVAYNGVANKASDSTAKSNIETAYKKLETTKIHTDKYPLKIESAGITTTGDIRTEYTSDGASFCITTSSVRAKTDYYETNGSGTYISGKCPNHLGYQGGAGTFSASSIFGESAPTGTYQVYTDGGGDLWIGDRFYNMRDNGVRIVGARVWEPASATAAFLSSPIQVRAYTQDWQGADLGGWNSLGSPALSATYSGPRTAGTWTYIWFNDSTNIAKSSAAAGVKDNATIAVRYDGNNYVAANPAMNGDYTESTQISRVYLSESEGVGRSVSNVYNGSAGYYYGIDILVTAL